MLTNFKYIIGILYLFVGMTYGQENLIEAKKLLENGQIQEAKAAFLVHKDDLNAIEYLGDIASFEQNWEVAISYYEKLVKAMPSNAMYNFKLGGALGMKAYYGSKFEAALIINDVKKYLKKAAELDPSHKEARRALVELYMQIPGFIGGSQTIAESYASDLDRLNEVDALLADAYIYKIQEYKDLAKSKYEEAIRVAVRKPSLISRNYLKYELGEASAIYEVQPEAGKKLLTEYIANYGYKDLKSPAWAYLRLAQIERNLNNQEVALKHIEQSLNIQPDFEKALVEKQRIKRL